MGCQEKLDAKTVGTIEWNKAIADESRPKVYPDGSLV
jgi:hypothetical protein